jgi:hypothetical protein
MGGLIRLCLRTFNLERLVRGEGLHGLGLGGLIRLGLRIFYLDTNCIKVGHFDI